MKPGPPPIPFPLKRLRGNASHRRLHAEPKPQREAQCPEPPAHITGYAADEWWTVGPELHRLGLLTLVDTATFSAYCMPYGRWRQAEEIIVRVATDIGCLRQ